MRYTPDRITKLEQNQIFVFGANEAGIHGAGAARLAVEKFEAIYGIGDGRQGQCYGISTKDCNIETLPLELIRPKVKEFLMYAESHPELEFLVTQIGCGLAGYSPKDIAPLFKSYTISSNVILPKVFWDFIN